MKLRSTFSTVLLGEMCSINFLFPYRLPTSYARVSDKDIEIIARYVNREYTPADGKNGYNCDEGRSMYQILSCSSYTLNVFRRKEIETSYFFLLLCPPCSTASYNPNPKSSASTPCMFHLLYSLFQTVHVLYSTFYSFYRLPNANQNSDS